MDYDTLKEFLTGNYSWTKFRNDLDEEIINYKYRHEIKGTSIPILLENFKGRKFKIDERIIDSFLKQLFSNDLDYWMLAYITEAILLHDCFEISEGVKDLLHEISECCLSSDPARELKTIKRL